MKIEVNSIAKSYGKKQVIKNVTFVAQSGQCIGILGSNGSGKSTLLSILAGVQKAEKGEFLCDGKDLLQNSGIRSRLVGYIPQGTPLIEELSAKDNLLLWYDKKTLKKELKEGILKTLGIDEFIKVPVSKMSGGMKKRLSIGCAIATHPPILLLDEPMAALDLVCKQAISDYLKVHKQMGGILVLVTHDALELGLCDECYIIKNGISEKFVYDGDMDRLVKRL